MSDVMKQALAARVEALPETAGPITVDAVPLDILEGVRDALLSGETHYTDRPGMRELREKVAATLGRTADEIVITTGDREGRFVTRLAFGETPDDIEIDIVIGNRDAVPGLASFRVGYVAAPKEKAAKLRSWKQALSICTAAPSQRAVLVALK